jgi:CheY-like chemotaxis protein
MARILIIDDEANIRNMLSLVLKKDGHQVATAENGVVGCQMTENATFDLLLVDLFMPEMDGLEVIQFIRKQCPEIRIIACSGGGNRGMDLLAAAKAFGAHYALYKPFDLDELRDIIQQALTTPDNE